MENTIQSKISKIAEIYLQAYKHYNFGFRRIVRSKNNYCKTFLKKNETLLGDSILFVKL